jgi:hypothetical protein
MLQCGKKCIHKSLLYGNCFMCCEIFGMKGMTLFSKFRDHLWGNGKLDF